MIFLQIKWHPLLPFSHSFNHSLRRRRPLPNNTMTSIFSLLATFTILRSTINQLLPKELRDYLWTLLRRFRPEPDFTMVIKETHHSSRNHLYISALTYLSGQIPISPSNSHKITVGKNESLRNFTLGLGKSTETVDFFHGIPIKWKFVSEIHSLQKWEMKSFELSFNKKHTEIVKSKYLPHILNTAKKLQDQERIVKFHTIRREWWSSAVTMDHPMTFDTLAMDGDLKKSIMDDLDGFIHGKEYYKKIGKVWKRGYLLYGPPGTGKSSLIAAMANYLNFDIYSLNLSAVKSDSVLEDLLLHVSNRSILVVEDIDCNVRLPNRQAGDGAPHSYDQLTLSGILNAIDGLLSCCGNERLVVFTTNYKERIDPALLQAGRMDKHICLSYCTFSTFKQLAANYLDISNHNLFPRIEALIADAKASPADVAGELMKHKDPNISLEGLIQFLETNTSPSMEGKRLEEKRSSKNNSSTEIIAVGGCDSVGEYSVSAELAPILNAVFLKHGNIVANCSLRSTQCLSKLLEVVCKIIQRLQGVEFGNLVDIDLEPKLASLDDLESVKVEVGWLRKRLVEIGEALELAKQCSSKEDRSINVEEIVSKRGAMWPVKTRTHPNSRNKGAIVETKLSHGNGKSLADGLI